MKIIKINYTYSLPNHYDAGPVVSWVGGEPGMVYKQNSTLLSKHYYLDL